MERECELVGYEAAERLTGIKRTTLTAMVCKRIIPHVRLGPRLVRFDPVELAAWIAERRVPARNANRDAERAAAPLRAGSPSQPRRARARAGRAR